MDEIAGEQQIFIVVLVCEEEDVDSDTVDGVLSAAEDTGRKQADVKCVGL